jgi:hypothetical protein
MFDERATRTPDLARLSRRTACDDGSLEEEAEPRKEHHIGGIPTWLVICSAALLLPTLASSSLAHAAEATIVGEGDVRTLPRPDAARLGPIEPGRRVRVSDKAVNGWRRIDLANDRRGGYILDQQVRLDDPAAPLPARPASPRVERPWVLRPEINIACVGCMSVFGNAAISDESSLAFTLGRNLTEALALEGTFGYGSDDATVTSTPLTFSNGTAPTTTMHVDLSPGYTFMTNLRWAPLRSWWGRHALTLAAGPSVIEGGVYGTVAFLHGEVAYEYRPPFPFNVLVGLGRDLALNSPGLLAPSCAGSLLGDTCLRQFRQGDLIWHFRLGAGVTF